VKEIITIELTYEIFVRVAQVYRERERERERERGTCDCFGTKSGYAHKYNM